MANPIQNVTLAETLRNAPPENTSPTSAIRARLKQGIISDVNEPHQLVDADVRELADTVPHKMWFSGPRGGVLFLNARYYEFTGLTCAEASGMGWRRAIHPDDLPALMRTRARDKAIQKQDEWSFEYRLRRHDGEYRWHLGRSVPLFDENGCVRRWVGTATEIHAEKEAAQKQRRFMREVLFAVTEGRLRLCDDVSELCAPLLEAPMEEDRVTLSRATLGVLRHRVVAACALAGLSPERTGDMVMASGEAAMNAVVHGGGSGEACVYATKDKGGMVQVRVVDSGSGIAEESLHRATLEPGYSSAGTFGHGFPLMLRLADRVYLLTGKRGTTVVVEQDALASEPDALEFVWNK